MFMCFLGCGLLGPYDVAFRYSLTVMSQFRAPNPHGASDTPHPKTNACSQGLLFGLESVQVLCDGIEAVIVLVLIILK